MDIWAIVVLAFVFIAAFAIWFVKGIFNSQDDRRQDLEHRMKVESGVIKTNAKADNSINGTDLDRRVREKYKHR